jgi:hypothetical protein
MRSQCGEQGKQSHELMPSIVFFNYAILSRRGKKDALLPVPKKVPEYTSNRAAGIAYVPLTVWSQARNRLLIFA